MSRRLWNSCGLMTMTPRRCLRLSSTQASQIVRALSLMTSWLQWWANSWRWSAGSRPRSRWRSPIFRRPTPCMQPLETNRMASSLARSRKMRWQACSISCVASKMCPWTTSLSSLSTCYTWRLRIWRCRPTLKTWKPCFKRIVSRCPSRDLTKVILPKRHLSHQPQYNKTWICSCRSRTWSKRRRKPSWINRWNQVASVIVSSKAPLTMILLVRWLRVWAMSTSRKRSQRKALALRNARKTSLSNRWS